MNYTDNKISTRQAIQMLARNGVSVNESEANTILDFLYLIARTYNRNNVGLTSTNLMENSNHERTH